MPRYARDVDIREAAWDGVHEALPARWHIGPITFDPGVIRPDGFRGAFTATARGRHPGRGKMPVTVSGTGEDEIAALRDLDDRLRGREDSGGYLDALRQGIRLAFVDAAEEWTRENVGRPMTADELAGVLERYAGK